MLDRNGETSLHYAIRTGRENTVQQFIHPRINMEDVSPYRFALSLRLPHIAKIFSPAGM